VHGRDLKYVGDGVQIKHEYSAFDLMMDEGKVFQSRRLLLKLGRKRFGVPEAQMESQLTSIAWSAWPKLF
jgi:hypothetical protein